MNRFYRDNKSPVMLRGDDGVIVNVSSGALDIHDADIHTRLVNKYMHRHTGVSTTLTSATVGDGTAYTIDVADATGFAVGDPVHLNTGSVESTHPIITAISVPTGASTFTLDRRLDIAHSIGDTVEKSVLDMAVVGTMASPVEYWAGPEAGEVWHLTRLLFELTHGTAGDLDLFGDQTPLTNGVTLRAKIGGAYTTLTNWKKNSHMKVDLFDLQFDPRSGGGGSYGTTGRGTFTNAGAILRLDGDLGDRFEIYIQDDLTGLDSFTMKVQGHFEGV